MSTALRVFNLTEYTDLRSLEFEYSKMQDENQTLSAKLKIMEELYRGGMAKFQEEQSRWRKREAELQIGQAQNAKELKDIVSALDKMKGQMIKFERMGIDCGWREEHEVDANSQNQRNISKQLQRVWNSFLFVMNSSSEQSSRFQKELEAYADQNCLYLKLQRQLKAEIGYLSEQLSKMQKVNAALTNELNLVRRENKDIKIRCYEGERNEDLNESQIEDGTIEDNSFTVDLLHYQKELLERTFEKTISAVENHSIATILCDIFAGYESVADAFREKLQIEYDLQDLQREYKREKNSRVSEKLLIELRKQIQQFRNQLQKQRDLLNKEEMNLEEHFVLLRATDREQKQARTYAMDIQKQLQTLQGHTIAKQKQTKELKQINQTKRNSEDSSIRQSSRIRFKPSQNNEQVMKEVVRRDRQNIERMFKQTRRIYFKNTSE